MTHNSRLKLIKERHRVLMESGLIGDVSGMPNMEDATGYPDYEDVDVYELDRLEARRERDDD